MTLAGINYSTLFVELFLFNRTQCLFIIRANIPYWHNFVYILMQYVTFHLVGVMFNRLVNNFEFNSFSHDNWTTIEEARPFFSSPEPKAHW